MTAAAYSDNGLGWMLDDLVGSVPGLRDVTLFSGDGLVLAHSATLGRDDADRLAAGMSGLRSLSSNSGEPTVDGPWRQTVVEFDQTYALLVAAGDGAYLAGRAWAETADVGDIAFALHKLVDRVRAEMASPARVDVGRSA
ncbi:roadblock/LC7 domain-containing protein [Peterkaempfera bronchialis]|uniref:roadblock/LC7 domain-containing protein n=1 Tax=Peterkaempfera bronchialis TaxID=2126346 RepID=UPI003C2FE485